MSWSLYTYRPVIKLPCTWKVHDLHIRPFPRKLEEPSVGSVVRLITLREQLLIGIWGESRHEPHTEKRNQLCSSAQETDRSRAPPWQRLGIRFFFFFSKLHVQICLCKVKYSLPTFTQKAFHYLFRLLCFPSKPLWLFRIILFPLYLSLAFRHENPHR